MNIENTKILTNKFGKNISKENLKELRESLSEISDEKYKTAEELKVKSSLFTVILSAVLGLFGAGSFYLGKIKLGIVKILCNIVLPLAISLIFLYWLAPLNEDYSLQANAIYEAVTENKSYNYSLSDLESVKEIFSSTNKNYKDELSQNEHDEEKLAEFCKVMEEQKNAFIANKLYLENFEHNLAKQINISNSVENNILLKATMSKVSESLKSVEASTDYTLIQNEMNKVCDELLALQSRASRAYSDYSFNYRFIRMFFSVMLIIGGIIIVGYWVGEIFRERNMCYEINYEKIKQALN